MIFELKPEEINEDIRDQSAPRVRKLQGPGYPPDVDRRVRQALQQIAQLQNTGNLNELGLGKTLGTQVNAIRDEDDMASDDESALATQQSIKKYIDDHTWTESDITDLGSYLENVVEDTSPQLGGTLDGQENRIEDITLNPYDIEYHDMGESQPSGVDGWAKLCTVTFPSSYDGIKGIVPLIVDVDGFHMLSFSFRAGAAYNTISDEDVEIYHYGADPNAGILSCCYTEKDTGSQYEFEIWIEIEGWRVVAGMPQWTLYGSGATVEWDWNVTNEASKPAVGGDYDAVTDVTFKKNLYDDLDMNGNDIDLAGGDITMGGGDINLEDGDIDNINQANFNGSAFPSTESQTVVDWTDGNHQEITLTGNRTFSFTAPDGPCMLSLRLVQDGTGSRTVTWPGSVKWPSGTAPTLSTGAGDVDIVTFRYNGTVYDAVFGLDFS